MGKDFSGVRRQKNNKLLQNSRGQVAIESILLLVLSVGLLFSASRILKERQVINNLVYGPTEKLAGMTESGVWAPAEEARRNHANTINRSLSVDPQGGQ